MPKKKKNKKIRYKKFTFALSDKECKQIVKYCKTHKTTPNKLFKNALREHLKSHLAKQNNIQYSENQLNLFETPIPYQLTIDINEHN